MAGAEVSKGNVLTVVAPQTGSAVSKGNAYTVVAPKTGISISKANVYTVLSTAVVATKRAIVAVSG